MHHVYLAKIKSFEGYTPVAKPDYAQHSIGFGTKALYPGETIDRAEAERRFAHEIASARKFVERQVPGLDEGTKAALISLTFNSGTKWASSGLGDAARQGNLDAIRERFVQYTKAGGKDLTGLVSRRLTEATWIGNGGAAKFLTAAGTAPIPRLQLSEPASSISAGALHPRESVDAVVPIRHGETQPSLSSECPISRTWPTAQISPATAFALSIAALEIATPRGNDDRRNSDSKATTRA